MSFIDGMFRFRMEVALVEAGYYGSIQCKIPKHPHESLSHLAAKALIFALEQPRELIWSGDLLSLTEPILIQNNLEGHCQHAIEIGCPDEKRILQFARSRNIESVSLWFLNRDELKQFLHYMKGSETNWIGKFTAYVIPSEILETLEEHTHSSNDWTVLYNQDALFISLSTQGTELQCGADLMALNLWDEFQVFLSDSSAGTAERN
jgi:uncharacterized protein YaeQ